MDIPGASVLTRFKSNPAKSRVFFRDQPALKHLNVACYPWCGVNYGKPKCFILSEEMWIISFLVPLLQTRHLLCGVCMFTVKQALTGK